jgi:capsular polysaccharide biosynthesis protein
VTVSTVYRSLWRHRLFIILMTALLAGVAFFVSSSQTKMYTASALVRVQQKVTNANDVFGSLQTGERLAQTYAEIARTDAVAREIRRELPQSVPDDAIVIDAAQVSSLELLKLAVTYSDPAIAARVANTVPTALTRVLRASGALPDTIATVDPATVPTSPSSPNVKLTVIIAIIIALILNSALALLVDAFSDRIGDPEEFERVVGHPVIATIPNLRFAPGPQPTVDGVENRGALARRSPDGRDRDG